MAEDEGVKIRAKRLRIPRVLDSGRVARLKAFKTRITEWAEPKETVYEEPIIVTVWEKRRKKVDGVTEWYDEVVFDHFYPDVIRFEDLVERKKAAGYSVSVSNAVLAYMLVFKRGSKSLITGFLRTFPEWRDLKVSAVGEALSRLAKEGLIRG